MALSTQSPPSSSPPAGVYQGGPTPVVPPVPGRAPTGPPPVAPVVGARRRRRLGRRLPSPASRRFLGIELTTPAVMRLLELATVAVVGVFLVVTTYAFASVRNTFTVVGDRTATSVTAALDVQYALADMDANVTALLLVGDRNDLGITRDAALATYRQRATVASDGMVRAAQTLDPGEEEPVRELVARLPDYQSHVDQALLLQKAGNNGAALDEQRQATDLMHTTLVPAAQRLADASVSKLDATYAEQQQRVSTVANTVTAVVVLCFVMLVASQLFVFRRTRRVLNVGLLAATAFLVAGTIMAAAGLSNASTNLRVAKTDSFDSVVALGRARAVLVDMRADEARWLLDGSRAAQYEAGFVTGSGAILRGTETPTLDRQRELAAQANQAVQTSRLPTGYAGYLVEAYRTNSSLDESNQLRAIFVRYATIHSADQQVRAWPANDRTGAVRRSLTDAASSFGDLDRGLRDAAGLNHQAFDDAINRGRTVATFWQIVLPLVALGCMALIVGGFRPRIAEYQRS